MLEAKQEVDWNHTSLLATLLYNSHGKRSKRVEDFHPFAKSIRRKTSVKTKEEWRNAIRQLRPAKGK